MAQSPLLTQLSTAPVFNTKAVARETGVPADTFRAWERRYGVPRPQRTAGGHRLYSEHDMAIIRWLRDRTAEGVNISHAVMLLTNSLDETAGEPASNTTSRSIERLLEEFLQLLTTFDLQHSEQLLSEAFSLYPFEQVLLEVIQPAMVEVGERWHRGEINVAAEHFATQFVRRKLSGLMNVFEGSSHRATVIVGCAPGELHDLGLLMSALFLVRRGWNVVYLGPQVPLADLLDTVTRVNPSLVCISASTMETASELIAVGRALQQTFPDVQFGYGGRVFNVNPELCASVPGTFLGHDAREFVDMVGVLLTRSTASNGEERDTR
ncbi:MAG TPA: cobalamin-dependent protein [Kouleothrix sp.]|uniref:MerR family transcriptional regulator n=1 Tax=Kouleothrix sp. TaxID=2779161 RepID=UPI002BD52D4D|nr:cobalamin-dependent protein [Kouleothrix sp.]HRC76420.1 cobalamin-dependent protein [Kouleothrix sp.]